MWIWCVLLMAICGCDGFNRCVLRCGCGLLPFNKPIVSRRAAASRKPELIWEVVRPKVDVAVDEDGSPSLAALTGGYPAVKVDVDSLVEEWIEKCIAEGRPAKKEQFSLKSAAPMAASKGPLVELVNKTLEREQMKDKSVTYVTSKELENLWKANTFKAMGKPMEDFDEDEAMMLLDDEDERELLGADEVSESLDDDTLQETVITLQELERLWNDRAKVAWGLPAQKFDPESALMLLDRDEGGADEEAEEDSAASVLPALEEGMPAMDGEASGVGELSVADQLAYWKRFPGRGNAQLRETLKRIYDDLEDQEPHRPAWKRERSFLTPDIDTQEFIGDIMFSNTYLTQRIPANWDDPEEGEMSEIYNSTATMALPGQPETDYNQHRQIWEELRLPIGPDHSRGKGLVETLQERAALARARRHGIDLDGASSSGTGSSGKHDNNFIETAPRPVGKFTSSSGTSSSGGKISGGKTSGKSASLSTSQEIDWENFDFSAAEDGLKQPAADEPDDIDEFFRAFDSADQRGSNDATSGAGSGLLSPKGAGKSGVSPESLMGRNQDAPPDYDDLSSEENAERRRELFQKNAVNGISCTSLTEPKFVLPEAERVRLQQSDLVGYEEWSKYGVDEGFDCDDMVSDEDVYAWQALKHLKQVTDLYLDDHSAAVRHHDVAKNVSRVLSNAFLGTNITQEPIPVYLTPDANRGIKYSDEIIEMKGKKILHPEMLDPRVEYENDTFTHNEEMETINKIGTIRVQYDWQPRRDLEHVIEPHKVEKLQPVIQFINHAADLQSTKDDIIIFNYKGIMRHIIGLRSTMLEMARKCYLEIKDLRLETTVTADKFDFS